MKAFDATSGLIAAYQLDSHGHGKPIGWKEIAATSGAEHFLWVHLNYTKSYARQWLKKESGLDKLLVASLIAEETRPRALIEEDSILVCLRGVNLNPGENPEDMVSIRLLLQKNRIISTRHRHLLSVDDIREAILANHSPSSPADFLVILNQHLAKRIGLVVNQLGEKMDQLEDAVIARESRLLRSQIADIRRQAILIRRYLSPQQDALQELQVHSTHPLLTDDACQQLREIHNRVTHYLEDLDALRDRAAILQEELSNRIAEQIDKRMYLLSVVAVLFLPLTFVTGLLGINVGGIPGANYTWSFTIVTIALVALGGLIGWLFRKKKWM